MKKIYESPELEVIEFGDEDVIQTSNPSSGGDQEIIQPPKEDEGNWIW